MQQIFVWSDGSFTLLRTLDFEQNIVSVTPFTRAALHYLVVCTDSVTVSCFLLQWTKERFQDPKPLPVSGRTSQVETVDMATEDTLLFVAVEGEHLCFISPHFNFIPDNISTIGSNILNFQS